MRKKDRNLSLVNFLPHFPFPTALICLVLPSLTPRATQLFCASLVLSVTLCPGCLCRERGSCGSAAASAAPTSQGKVLAGLPCIPHCREVPSSGVRWSPAALCCSARVRKVSVKSLPSTKGCESGGAFPSALRAGSWVLFLGGGSSQRAEESKGSLISRLYLAYQGVLPSWF